MSGKILDGKKISAEIREELKEKTKELKERGIIPVLAPILVGEDPGSASYVRLKEKGAAEVGISSKSVRLPEDVSEEELLKKIENLNRDPNINGIFIQMPLPEHLNEDKALNAICPDKDVDGLNPLSVGRAWVGKPIFFPATPIGIHEMLLRSGYTNLKRKNAVIVNMDNLVGKPLASIWTQESIGVNVTLCYPDTPDLARYTKEADIVVVSVNRAKFLTANMVKEGVIAIDFGTNYIEDPTSKNGRKLVGDIDFDAVKEKAEAITPVPGGAGPMTITMLLVNTIRATEMQSGLTK